MTINCKGNLIDLTQPKVMGILNLTPDSFYDGGKYTDPDSIIFQVEKMILEGADFIDVGAYSSRPNAQDISTDVELARILPVVERLLEEFPELLISIDTYRSRVAKECISLGAAMINDISAGKLDGKMIPTVAEHQVPYVMMHLKGTPKTMQRQTTYDDLIGDILYYFSERIAAARSLGINDIIVDPGFGFAKTLEQNYCLLQNLQFLKSFNLPILVGLSRKSMIYRLLDLDTDRALNGTTALNMVALLRGANILRVHDVKEAVECIKLTEALVLS
ncbi:dihydropteroate synthase [Flavobacteriaceae bacterium F89]|uniref:Dihydropteroate synthase n=1 Tax=Cerina litoralis TaxID=2874477 RepID=A0AAE3EU87_9FLAO|nr:dihydropteroate synthase [Cerina litoralis]MCG2459712.1 dihydropteroate synthase [Cerina litoralis]